MSNEKKSVNITVKIKFGKYCKDAKFEVQKESDAEMNVYNSNGNIICCSMYIDDIKMTLKDQMNYFNTNYSVVKEKWVELYGEIA